MIIKCNSCDKRFVVEDKLIPNKGRMVQCSSCDSRWLQLPLKNIETIKTNLEINPSEIYNNKKTKKIKRRKAQEIVVKKDLGFFGYIFILLIIFAAGIGILETFKKELLNYWPNLEYHLNYIYESIKNIVTIFRDLLNQY